jgi:hypothetical protein
MALRKTATPRGSTPWGLIAMVTLVLGIELLIVRRDEGLRSVHASSWRATTKQLNRLYTGHAKSTGKTKARAHDPGPEILCFGDSLVKFGVYPQILEKQRGRTAYNLAITTGPTPASYFLFRRVLDRGGKPTVIIIDAAEGVLDAGPRSTKRVYPWADLLTLREAAEIAFTSCDADFFVRTTLGAALQSANARPEIRSNIITALQGLPSGLRLLNSRFLDNWARNQGAHVNAKADYEEGLYPPSGENPGKWAPDAVNVCYLERLFELAKRNDVAVFWLLPPYHPFTQAHSRFRGEERRFARFVKELQSRHPEVVVVDGRYSGYDRTRFVDEAHLDGEGGTSVTVALAELIDAYLAEPARFPKWCKLPDFEARDPGILLYEGNFYATKARSTAETIRR